MKKFAVFDIDGTLIRWQLYHGLVDQLAKEGHVSQDQRTAIKNARMSWKNRHHEDTFTDYQTTLVSVFHDILHSLPVEAFDRAIDTVFDTYKDQVYTYTRDLLKTLKQQGYTLFAISGSHHEIIKKLADYYGFDDAVGNEYQRNVHTFTGKHQYVVENKPEILKKLVAKHGVGWGKSIAVGDSGSDASLLKLVEQPIAFNPDRKLLVTAKEHGWALVIERKNVIYNLEQIDGRYLLV